MLIFVKHFAQIRGKMYNCSKYEKFTEHVLKNTPSLYQRFRNENYFLKKGKVYFYLFRDFMLHTYVSNNAIIGRIGF